MEYVAQLSRSLLLSCRGFSLGLFHARSSAQSGIAMIIWALYWIKAYGFENIICFGFRCFIFSLMNFVYFGM